MILILKSSSASIAVQFAFLILFLNLLCNSHCLSNHIELHREHRDDDDSNKSFIIDYDKNTFLKDGKPFRYISGSFHYMRSLRDHWSDIFDKFRLAGLNAVQTYVEWSSHQPYPEETYNFDGNLDIFEYFRLAQKHDLLVILRIGPYIDAERDMGGLPPWLLWQKENMGQRLRTSDLEFNYFVSRWFDFLLPKLIPYLYKNGGPIIMIQVENEYGSFGCDKNYTSYLRDLIRMHLGDDVVLFTTDGNGPSYLNCGVIEGVYPTIDFGPNTLAYTNSSFEIQRQFAPKGPLVNSEYYSGWLDHWGKPHSQISSSNVGHGLDYILSLGASVNIYMFYGGTSYGFKSGSNVDPSFDACPTSYDYDAPLTETRDPTPKYFAIKNVNSKYFPVPEPNPSVSNKGYYGQIDLQPFSFLVGSSELKNFMDSNPVSSLNPLSFEELKVDSGFILYETTVKFLTTDPALLLFTDLKDRAYIYVDRTFVGIVSRNQNPMSIPLVVDKGSQLSILVENQGRPCYGSSLGESKGLGSKVYLDNQPLQHWKMYRLSETNLNPGMLSKYAMKVSNSTSHTSTKLKTSSNGSGSFFFGLFTLPLNSSHGVFDTFINFDGWRKGIVAVNELILGRYWPVMGPQKTLYLPASVLKPYPQKNTIIIFELESAPAECLQPSRFHEDESSGCHVTLTDTHIIDAETPDKETFKYFTKPQGSYLNEI